MNKHLINFLISLKNGSFSKKDILCFKNHPTIENVCDLLYREGLIQTYTIKNSNLTVYLKYSFDKPILKEISILSKPSNQKNLSFNQISRLPTKKKIFVISTDIGLLTNTECKKNNRGGVVLFSC